MAPGWPSLLVPGSRCLATAGRFVILGLALILAQDSAAQQGSPPRTPSPMDEPIRLLTEARKAFDGVRDYSCLLVKRERVDDQVGPDNVIQMKVRKEPFSIALNWVGPKNMVGQEAYYVAGQNDNKLRVKGAGGLGLFGYVTIDPNDKRVRSASKHSITEAGIGNMLARFEKGWENERKLGLTRVTIAEYEYNSRRCWRVETIHPPNSQDKFLHYRSILYLDKEHKLPIRLECYDWPTQPGDTKGSLAEIVSFAHLRLNVGLTDENFAR